MAYETFLINRDPSLHLRDAQHAHQFYTDFGHLFSPKVKFLYHVVFQLSEEPGITISRLYNKEIGVLAKNCDLPQYRINVDTRKQYNRNKNFQTGINYEEVKIVFHDDNAGVTSAMIEEYYRYYYRDGNKVRENPGSVQDFARFDTYRYGQEDGIPRYGLDTAFATNRQNHFFKNIIIYQLARQYWTSFTLVNPLVTGIGHDTLDYSAGAEIMENTFSIAYEGVVYNRGEVIEGDQPVGFTDPETRYDTVFSPIISGSRYPSSLDKQEPTVNVSGERTPENLIFSTVEQITSQDSLARPLLNQVTPNEQETLSRLAFDQADQISLSGLASGSTGLPQGQTQVPLSRVASGSARLSQGGLQSFEIPKADFGNLPEVSTTRQISVKNVDPDDILQTINENPELFDTVVQQNLAKGNIDTENSYTLNDWNTFDETQKTIFRDIYTQEVRNGNPNVIKTSSKIIGS